MYDHHDPNPQSASLVLSRQAADRYAVLSAVRERRAARRPGTRPASARPLKSRRRVVIDGWIRRLGLG
jgi:hypothetical protein